MIDANVTIVGPCVIGNYVHVGPGVVIGADGMEFHRNKKGVLVETIHRGDVVLGNNVTIRANTTIHRGVYGSTLIGDGTKIGPNCNITHDVKIGKHCLITGATTIAGDTVLLDRVYVGPHTIVGTRLRIGNDSSVRIGSLVLHDVPDGLTVAGDPAEPYDVFKRHRDRLRKLLDGTNP